MSITVGQRASRSLTLTSERVSQFANISGDRNPLHFDAAFAARTKFITWCRLRMAERP